MKRKIRIILLIIVPIAAVAFMHFVFNIQEPYPEGDLSYLDDTRYFSGESNAPPIETLKYLYVYERQNLHEFDILVDFTEGKLYAGANHWSFDLEWMQPGGVLTVEGADKLRGLVERHGVWNWKKAYNSKFGEIVISHWTVSLEYEDGTVQVHKGEEANMPEGFEDFIGGAMSVAMEAYPGRYDEVFNSRFNYLNDTDRDELTHGTQLETAIPPDSDE
jgi:hypothetical protein